MEISRRQMLIGAATAMAASRAGAQTQARSARPDSFEVTQSPIVLSGLAPEHEGLRVAQLSDLHIGKGTPDGRIIAAVRQLNALHPDLVLLTGDFVTRKGDPVPRVGELLRDIHAPAFATLGNHDHWVDPRGVQRVLEHAGICVLSNANTRLTVRGASLAVLGVDDGLTRHDDVERTFRGAPEGGTRLVMMHTPRTARKLPADKGLACFAGHTHGGQMVIPGLTPLCFRVSGEPYFRGAYQVNGNHLYVNRGLGFGRGSALPRFGSEPELALFVLHRA